MANTVAGVLLEGLHSARPAANAVSAGTLYSETDTNAVYQSDGVSVWTVWAGPFTGSSGLTNPLTTLGDQIYGANPITGGLATPARYAIGGSNTLLHGGHIPPAWSAVVEGDLSFTNVTTANATTSQHGLLPKLNGSNSMYLDGTGAFTTPAGGGGGATPSGFVLTKQGPVLTPGAGGAWDAYLVESPCVFFDEKSGRYGMVYTGYNAGPTNAQIGLAWSDDGLTWTKDAANPIFSYSGSGFDADGTTGPVIYQEGGTYYLFYIGLTATGYEGGTPSLGVAHSTSLTGSWTRTGQIIAPSGGGWRSAAVYHPSVVLVGSTYYLFFNAKDGSGAESIGYATATSPTGTWTVDDVNSPVLSPTGGSNWDSTYVGDPSIFRLGDLWFMAYYGAQGGYTNVSDGLAWTSASNFPLGWTRWPYNPLLVPTGSSWDQGGAGKPYIFFMGNRLLHYYTGDTTTLSSNRRIGLAVSDIPVPFASFVSPMTTAGDIIYAKAGGTPARQGIGGSNTVLHAGSIPPAWSAVVEGDFSFSAITTANATTSQHGLLPKLNGSNTMYLDGTGAFSTPTGGGGSIEVKEIDGSPDVTGVTIIQVSNGTLTDNGGGNVTITTGGGGGSFTTYDSLIGGMANLVHRWKFEEASGNFADAVGSLTLTVAGSAFTYSVAGGPVSGASGSATFGASSYAESSGLGSIPTSSGARTFVLVYRGVTAPGSTTYCLMNYGAASTRQWWAPQINDYSVAQNISLDTYGDDNVTTNASPTGVSGWGGLVYCWHLAAFAYDGQESTLIWFDGQTNSRTLGATLGTSSSGNFRIGQTTAGANQLPACTFDDLAVFSRMLNPYEIQQLYAALAGALP